jgi:hypothetical protein
MDDDAVDSALADSEAEAPRETDEIDAVVDLWFDESFRGSVVARTPDAWNVAYAASQDLKLRLRKMRSM